MATTTTKTKQTTTTPQPFRVGRVRAYRRNRVWYHEHGAPSTPASARIEPPRAPPPPRSTRNSRARRRPPSVLKVE